MMFAYQRYLLNEKNDRSNQKDKRYCDGSMQRYLEMRWVSEEKLNKFQALK